MLRVIVTCSAAPSPDAVVEVPVMSLHTAMSVRLDGVVTVDSFSTVTVWVKVAPGPMLVSVAPPKVSCCTPPVLSETTPEVAPTVTGAVAVNAALVRPTVAPITSAPATTTARTA